MTVELNHRRLKANGITQHFIDVGSGPPVVLLHGFPMTSYSWRKQIPVLRERYRLIVPDLRGYGASEKPAGGYDKRTMASDIRALMAELGVERAAIVGHDRGARVGTRFAKDYPEATARFAAFDNIPTRFILENMNAEFAYAAWFFTFNAVRDLPEALIAGREDIWLRFFITNWTHDPEALSEEELAVYIRAYSQPGALRGAFEDYRAWRTDLEQDQADAGVKIACPTLSLWGAEFEANKKVDLASVWRGMADDLRTAPIPLAGHLPHEERPGEVNRILLEFLEPWKG